MPSFIATGATKDDYWLVNGSRDFSVLPANTITGWNIDLPIRLHVGNVAFGQIHMQKHVYHLKDRQRRPIPELVHFKLGQGATIYNTETTKKIKMKFGLSPNALITMERRYAYAEGKREDYLSMITIYPAHELDGVEIGRYDGRLSQQLLLTKAKAAAAATVAPGATLQTTASPTLAGAKS